MEGRQEQRVTQTSTLMEDAEVQVAPATKEKATQTDPQEEATPGDSSGSKEMVDTYCGSAVFYYVFPSTEC